MDTLVASTRALESNTPGDATYESIENSIQDLTSLRDALATKIRNALDAAAFGGQGLPASASNWIRQAQALLSQAADLAAGP